MTKKTTRKKKVKRPYSKRKGADFERDVCRFLSRWMTSGRRDDLFWRSAMSGGSATIGKYKGINRVAQSGDIAAIDKHGFWFVENFYIELKRYKKLELHKVFNKSGLLVKFWNDTVSEATSYLKKPILIAKQDKFPILIVVDYRGREFFNPAVNPVVFVPDFDMNVYLMKYFCKSVDIKKIMREWKNK